MDLLYSNRESIVIEREILKAIECSPQMPGQEITNILTLKPRELLCARS